MARKPPPELTLQKHIADFFVREHKYGVLPPLAEQDVIRVHLDEKLGELKRIITGIKTQIATLTAYRKSLIHECVTGQRRISEADLAAMKQRQADPPRRHQI